MIPVSPDSLRRARYATELAARRYEAVDSRSRLVASEFQPRKNAALQRIRDLEHRTASSQSWRGNKKMLGAMRDSCAERFL